MLAAIAAIATTVGAFLLSVWPDVFATFVGLVLGVPFALWTDRRLKAHEERLRNTEDKQRLDRALQVLETALQFNRQRFAYLLQTLANAQAAFDASLDHSAWEACRREVVTILRDPALQRRLAFHFSRVSSLSRLNGTYLDFVAGIGSALGGVERTRDALKTYLQGHIGELDAEAEQLLAACAAVRNGA